MPRTEDAKILFSARGRVRRMQQSRRKKNEITAKKKKNGLEIGNLDSKNHLTRKKGGEPEIPTKLKRLTEEKIFDRFGSRIAEAHPISSGHTREQGCVLLPKKDNGTKFLWKGNQRGPTGESD